MTTMNDPITTWQAARIIGCTQRHVVKLFHAGLITGQYFGNIIQIDKASAEQYTPERSGPRKGGPVAIELAQPYNKV
mgnify:FL=1